MKFKLNFHLPAFTPVKVFPTKDTENARNNSPAQEAPPPSDLRPDIKSPRRNNPGAWIKKLVAPKKKPNAVVQDNPFAPRRQNNRPTAAPIHRPNFIPFDARKEVAAVEHILLNSAKDYLLSKDKDTFTVPKFNSIMQHYINHGVKEIDQRFERALKNPIPGQSTDKLQNAREQAKQHIARSLYNKCGELGWALPVRKGSNIVWEPSKGPLLIKQGLSLQQLKLKKANIANGNFGSVSIFENDSGGKLIGKISKNNMLDERGGIKDDLAEELKAYQTIYNTVGPHPNLVNVYGIAQVPNNGAMKRTLLMDMIPGADKERSGSTGQKTFDALRKCWDTGKISSEEYWGAMQFFGRRLLDVTEHIAKAGVVHNDIKPDNFLVNEKTGEPVLVDFGVWSATGKQAPTFPLKFASPEARQWQGVDERSDVFMVGATLLDGVEEHKTVPNKGIFKKNAIRNSEGNVVRQPGTYAANTAYTNFMNRVLAKNKHIRPNANEAKKFDFLNDRMLDDDAAKAVITKVLSLANKEAQKPAEEQWKSATPQAKPQVRVTKAREEFTQLALDAFYKNPTLHDYANLRDAGKTDPALKKLLDGNALDYLQGHLEQEARTHVRGFLAGAPWYYEAIRILNAGPKEIKEPQAIKSGADQNGVRLKNTDENIDPNYGRFVKKEVQKSFGQRVNIEEFIQELRNYANEAEAQLRKIGTLKKIRDPSLSEQVAKVHRRARAARRMVEILETELPSPKKPPLPEKRSSPESLAIIKERARQLERQLKRRK